MRAGLAALALGLAACGQTPLLKIAASDYSPLRVGSAWLYVAPDGSPGFERRIASAGSYFGRQAFVVSTVFAGLTTTGYLSDMGTSLDFYDAASGQWAVSRKLPLVTGNRWDLLPAPNTTGRTFVETTENLSLPAGEFLRCYRLRTEVKVYNPGSGVTTTTESLAWAAPEVGDVQYGSLGVTGTVTVTSVLQSYRAGP